MNNEQMLEAFLRGVEFQNRMPFFYFYRRDILYWDEYAYYNRN